MILKSLGYAVERREGPAITVPLVSPPRVIEQPETTVEAQPAPVAEEPASSEAPADESGTAPGPEPVSSQAEVAADPPLSETPSSPEILEQLPSLSDEVMPAALGEPTSEAASKETTDAASTEAASTEAPSTDAASAGPRSAADADPVTTEPVLIDVWRQHRRHEGGHARPARRPDRGDRRPRQGDHQGARPEGRPVGDAPAADRPQGDRPPRRDRRPDSRPERREGQGDGNEPQNRQSRGPGRPDDRRNSRPEKRPERRDNPPERRRNCLIPIHRSPSCWPSRHSSRTARSRRRPSCVRKTAPRQVAVVRTLLQVPDLRRKACRERICPGERAAEHGFRKGAGGRRRGHRRAGASHAGRAGR